MNGGTNRGQADGFQLGVLNKVKDVKTQVRHSAQNRVEDLQVFPMGRRAGEGLMCLLVR